MNKEHLHPDGRPYTKEEFIEKIKTDETFAKRFGNLGPIYGKQWRCWGGKLVPKRLKAEGKLPVTQYVMEGQIDQIADLISKIKTDPDSRRLMVNSWNVGQLSEMVLPPCHYGFQVYTRELSYEERCKVFQSTERFKKENREHIKELNIKIMNDANIPTRAISLMFNMRSTDVGLGLSFNLASYGLLLMMIAKQVNMVPEELIYNGGDVHLYANHIEPIKAQLTRQSYPLPTVKISDRQVKDISDYTLEDIVLENYQSHPSIKMPLSN